MLWIGLMTFGALQAQDNGPQERDAGVIPGLHSGLLFQPRGSLILATGVWTAVVRFQHSEVKTQADALRRQFSEISETLTNLNRRQGNETYTPRDEQSRRTFFLNYMLEMWFREKTWMETEVRAAEQEITELKTELRLSRRQRALIPFLGDGLKWLFGTSTEKDTERLHNQIKNVQASVGELHHITELQATLIGALKKEQTTNKRNIALLAEKMSELEITLAENENANHMILVNIRRENDLQRIISSAIRTAGATVMAFRHEVQKIVQAMAHTQQGKVTPTILHPKNLKITLQTIKQHLPEGWVPAVSLSDTPAEIYNVLEIDALAVKGGWEVHIKIPLKCQPYGDFHLYQVKPVPTHFVNSTMALETEAPAEYFAISRDQRLHIEAGSQDIEKCKHSSRKTICRDFSPLIQESRTGCLYNAFRDNRDKADTECVRKVVRSSPQIYALSAKKWLYALPHEELFALQCVGNEEPTKGFRLQGTGIFALPPGCAAMGDRYIVPAHLRREAEKAEHFQMDDLTHFKLDLNLSVLFSRIPVTKALNQTVLKEIVATMPTTEEEDPMLTELKERIENWTETPTSEDTTGTSFLGHTSISLGTAGIIGVIVLAFLLYRKTSGNPTTVVQTPQHVPVTHPVEQSATALIALQTRIHHLEQAYQELKSEVEATRKMEGSVTELQKKYEEMVMLL